jgi:putative transposase
LQRLQPACKGFSLLAKASATGEVLMSSHVFSEIYLHANWHTEQNKSILIPEVEAFVHTYIRNRCKTTKGVFFEECNGTENHVHLAVRIEPHVTISDFFGELKGGCSFEANKHFSRKFLYWQRGYGVVSFSKKHLPWVVEYVRRQKAHHAPGGVLNATLEQTDLDAPENG